MKTAILSALTTLLLAAPSGDPIPVNYPELSNFEYEEGMELPEFVTKYHEKKITISGFMKTEDGSIEGDVDYFILVNDACGCEGTPKLNEMIFCSMPEGQTTRLKPGNATVTGTLYVEEEIVDEIVVSLYSMSVESVK